MLYTLVCREYVGKHGRLYIYVMYMSLCARCVYTAVYNASQSISRACSNACVVNSVWFNNAHHVGYVSHLMYIATRIGQLHVYVWMIHWLNCPYTLLALLALMVVVLDLEAVSVAAARFGSGNCRFLIWN